jgi:hypothetical protein
MATQPIKMVLITVKNTTSPRTRRPAVSMTIPSRMHAHKGGVGRPVKRIAELLS